MCQVFQVHIYNNYILEYIYGVNLIYIKAAKLSKIEFFSNYYQLMLLKHFQNTFIHKNIKLFKRQKISSSLKILTQIYYLILYHTSPLSKSYYFYILLLYNNSIFNASQTQSIRSSNSSKTQGRSHTINSLLWSNYRRP